MTEPLGLGPPADGAAGSSPTARPCSRPGSRPFAQASPGPEEELRDLLQPERWTALLERSAQGELDELARGRGRGRAGRRAPGESLLPAALRHPRARPLLPALPAALRARTARPSPSRSWPSTSSATGASRACSRPRRTKSARRLVEAQEQAARARERARELQRANDALRRSERQSQHRAEQIGLLAAVTRRIAGDPGAGRAHAGGGRSDPGDVSNYTYVAVVVLDDEGVLVGRWAGRRGWAAQQRPRPGPAGRDHRSRHPRRAPRRSRPTCRATPTTTPTCAGTRSEMVVPLLDGRRGGRGHRLPEREDGGLRPRRRGRGRGPGRVPGRGPAQRAPLRRARR